MSGIRFLRDLICKNEFGMTEPVVYIHFDGEGWFSLRQIASLFFPDRNEEGLQLSLWCAANVKKCKYYQTSVSNGICEQLYDRKIRNILISAGIDVKWVIDVQTTQKMLNTYDPYVSASTLITFNTVLTEMLKKGGRKRAVSGKERMKIAAAQGWKCKSCENPFDKELTFEIDHRIAWAKGGSTRQLNLQALCPNCHAKKSNSEKHYIFQNIKYG